MALEDDDISKLIMQRISTIDTQSVEIQLERERALEHYRMEPFGDEIEGLSDFVTSDVMDTIEWLLPQIIEMFIGPEAPGAFRSRGAKDAEAARKESEFVRHVYNDQNDGFLNTYTWFKDALLQKNGIARSWWDESVDEVQETYEFRTFEQYISIVADDDIEIEAVTVFKDEDDDEGISLETAEKEFGFSFDDDVLTLDDPNNILLLDNLRFDIDIIRTEDNSQVRIDVIAPEKFFVDLTNPSVSLKDCDFCGDWEILTVSDLKVDGVSQEIIDEITTISESTDSEVNARNKKEGGLHENTAIISDAARKIKIWTVYIREDFDDSGKVELWMVRLGGDAGDVMIDREISDGVPYKVLTPIINPHKFYGTSMADLVIQIQKLKSRMWRGVLDNLALVNNPVKIYNPKLTNAEDLLYWGPGATIRSEDPTGGIINHTTPFTAAASLEVMPLIDQMRQERTGVNPQSQGLDIKALADSTNLIGPMIMSQMLARVKLIARIFAETGFKDIMISIHELVSKHVKSEQRFELVGEEITVDPRQWTKRTDYTVRVGVGHVDNIQRMQGITAIKANQTLIASNGGLGGPLLTEDNVYQVLLEEGRLLGYPDAAKFYRDPATFQPPPPVETPLDEALEIEKAKTIGDLKKAEMTNAVKVKISGDELQLERHKINVQELLKKEEMVLKYGPSDRQNTKTRGSSEDAT